MNADIDRDLWSATDLAHMARESHAAGDMTKALDEAALALNAARRAVDALVAEARNTGTPWQTIGDALGMTRQAAHEKYAHRI